MVPKLGIFREQQVFLDHCFAKSFANLGSSNLESLYDIVVCDCLHQF